MTMPKEQRSPPVSSQVRRRSPGGSMYLALFKLDGKAPRNRSERAPCASFPPSDSRRRRRLLRGPGGHHHRATALLPARPAARRLRGPQRLLGARRGRDVRVGHSRLAQRQRGGDAESELQRRGQHHPGDGRLHHAGDGGRALGRGRGAARHQRPVASTQRLLPDHHGGTGLGCHAFRCSRAGQ